MNNSEMEKFDKGFGFMFKFALAFIAFVFCIVLLFWGVTAYLVVTKGPEAVQRIERIGDAYADKLEQENKNNKKPE
jgi:hypothetical protein